MIESSHTITLFAELPVSRRGPSPLLVSIFLHGVAIGLVYFGLRHAVRVEDNSLVERYTVRLLNLRTPEPQMHPPAESSGGSRDAQTAARALRPGGSVSAPSVPRQLAQLLPAPQTLVQPNLPPNLLLPKETPIPLVLMWSHESTPVRQLVPPAPHPITAADIRPSLEAPNRESRVADLKISESAFVTKAPAPLPSTTSPVVVRGPEPVKRVPETASKPASQPTPATVMSLSELHMPEGTVALPLANETAPSGPTGVLAPGKPENAAQAGKGNPASKQDGSGPGQSSGDHGNHDASSAGPGQSGSGAGPNPNSGANSGLNPNSGTKQGTDVASGGAPEPGNGGSVVRIKLPPDGQFGIVVVGSSLAERYPETVGLWGGRMAYTVYLHVGLAKNWILQYSLPRAAEASVAGTVAKPEAPWPYDIVRPTLAPGDAVEDAIMVHGFVNISGRFEQLAVVFPTEFAQAKFVLSALQQWRFRPALQKGQIAAVEVLLIIPQEGE